MLQSRSGDFCKTCSSGPLPQNRIAVATPALEVAEDNEPCSPARWAGTQLSWTGPGHCPRLASNRLEPPTDPALVLLGGRGGGNAASFPGLRGGSSPLPTPPLLVANAAASEREEPSPAPAAPQKKIWLVAGGPGSPLPSPASRFCNLCSTLPAKKLS